MNNNYLSDYVKMAIIKNKIQMKDEKAVAYLTEYFENIIFNVVSIASIITYINNCTIVNKKSIDIVKKYLDGMCGSASKVTGGNVLLPSEYFGVDSTRYSAMNNNLGDVLKVDFASGIARPQIGGGSKSKTNAKAKVVKPIPANIKNMLNYYKLKASVETIKTITKMIEQYIKCLMEHLKIQKSKVSCITIKKIIKSNKLFDIFN